MTRHGLRRRMSSLGTVVGLGVTLPFALSATPAHAQPILSVDKSHEGNFARGGQGVYTITVTNSGDEPASPLTLTDNLPTGLTVADIQGDLASTCNVTNSGTTVTCNGGWGLAGPGSTEFVITVNVADDAPCSVTNTVTVTQGGGTTVSDSDQTTITGGDCDNGGGGGGGSILPINLNGVIPMFNNISINDNINSPGASNDSRQTFRLDAP